MTCALKPCSLLLLDYPTIKQTHFHGPTKGKMQPLLSSFYSCTQVCSGAEVMVGSEQSESVSGSVVSDSLQPHGPEPARLLCPWDFPGKNTGVGCHSLLQGIFLIQGSNLGLLHFRQIRNRLSHQGSKMAKSQTINAWRKRNRGLPWWSQCRGLGSISGQGTRFCMPQLKIIHATTKTEDPVCRN